MNNFYVIEKKFLINIRKRGKLLWSVYVCIDYRCKYLGVNNIYIVIIINMLWIVLFAFVLMIYRLYRFIGS